MKEREVDSALGALREAGLVHIMTPKKDSRESEDIAEKLERCKQAYGILEQHIGSEKPTDQKKDLSEVIDQVLTLDDEISDIHDRLRSLNHMERFFEEWGSFDPDQVHQLRRQGVVLQFLRLKHEELPGDIPYIVLKREKTHTRIMAVDLTGDSTSHEETVSIPELGPESIIQERNRLHKRIAEIEACYAELSWSVKPLGKLMESLKQDLEFHEVKNGLEEAEPVRYLVGFVPKENLHLVSELASQQAWALMIDDPHEEEPVPTKLKNRPFVRMIEPIFEILGTVPGYREYDISGLFLGFFAIFVAMIIGDAGYGALFLVITLVLTMKARKITKLTGLLYLLSTTTLVWGALTGTWFGSETLASWPPLHALMMPRLASFPDIAQVETIITQQNVMYLCFIIGTVQLSIACLMNFKRDVPKLSSFAHIGWLMMIIGLYFLVLNLVLGFDLPDWAVYLIGGGFALIIIFGSQQPGRNFFKGLAYGLAGLFTTFLDSISSFSNIISYIRLFAVGMASVAISSSFNSMAAPMLGGVLFPAALLILLIGHGLNIVMALLSVFVHGIRLNMLEFSGQLSMEWTGFKYAPFGENRKIQDN